MLFNSFEFVFLFLPACVAVFALLPRATRKYWLIAASLFFYGYWNAWYLALIIGSSVVNYALGLTIARLGKPRGRPWLAAGVAANIAVIGVFKYSDLAIATADAAGAHFSLLHIALPLAISFFTFQKIAFLADCYRGIVAPKKFSDYFLFVLFFPQLISGPIVLYQEVVPQFDDPNRLRASAEDLSLGLAMFSFGLAKKVLLADAFAQWSDATFRFADGGGMPTAREAWLGALFFTFQIYFDFSGYSDMAIGLARMFGIVFPANFWSPYKATSIIDFWRRWHMTLSRFLRDNLYIPLGGNRKGPWRRYVNVMLTMLIGGLWHGAAWNFALWGGLHGLYLTVNHLWRGMRGGREAGVLGRLAGWALTAPAVVLAWVLFRARTLAGAEHFYLAMLGRGARVSHGLSGGVAAAYLAAGVAIVLLLPNVQEWMARYRPLLVQPPETGPLLWLPAFRLSAPYACAAGLLFFVSLYVIGYSGYVAFLYRFF